MFGLVGIVAEFDSIVAVCDAYYSVDFPVAAAAAGFVEIAKAAAALGIVVIVAEILVGVSR